MSEKIKEDPLMASGFWELLLTRFSQQPSMLHESIALIITNQKIINERLHNIEGYIV